MNENDFMTDDFMIGEDDGAPQKPYVPRFEQDLQKAGGSLSALAKEKEAEMNNAAEAIAEEPEPEPEYAPEQQFEYNEADIDFVYDEDGTYDYNLEDISADSIALDEMDVNVKLEDMRTDKNSMISSIKNQMMADDLAMSVEDRPKLEDMSEEYAPTKKKEESLLHKNKLDRDEKEIIKNRLKNELAAKHEGYDQKKSAEMYRKLMAEQKAKAAKKGFLMLLLTAAFGLATAALSYFLDMNADGTRAYMEIIPLGALVFSLLMMIKSKFFKILSTIYFIANTIALMGPGLLIYAMSPANQEADGYIVKLVLYVAAIAVSAVTCYQLAANKGIKDYFSYNPEKYQNKRGRR